MNKKTNKSAIVFILLLASMLLIPIMSAADPPTVTIDPEQPKPKGTVTFTVSIDEEQTVTEAVIYVEECESGLCFTDTFNETLSKTGTNTYEGTITLRHSTAVEMKYRVGYQTSSGWIWYPEAAAGRVTVDLDTSSSNNGNNGDGDSSDTPGFELVSILAAVSLISIIVYRRRR